MRDLPLNALRAFAVVYDCGGIRPAARTLGIAHSSVSRHVHELEAWLGVPLVDGSVGGRTLAFTAQGEALGRAGLQSLRGLQNAVAALRERHRPNAVSITTSPSFAARWLLPRLHLIAALLPWIELSVTAEQRIVDPHEQGADIALRMGRGPWHGLACEPLMDDCLFPVMSPAYWEHAGRPTRIVDLARLALVHDRDPNASWQAWRSAHGPAALDVRSGPRFASSDLVLRAAAEGLGVALARGRLAEADFASGTLMRPFGAAAIALPQAYWIVRSPVVPVRTAVDHVVEWLKAEAGSDRAAVREPLAPSAHKPSPS